MGYKKMFKRRRKPSPFRGITPTRLMRRKALGTYDVLANASSQAYKNPDERDNLYGGYKYDRSLSDERNAIYHREAKDGVEADTIHAIRGTDPASKYDIAQDVAVTFGFSHLTNRHKKTKNLHNRVIDKYGETKLTGHSLGGKIANDIARETNSKAVVYNPGRGIGDVGSNIRDARDPDKRLSSANRVSTVRTRYDPFSALGNIAGRNIKNIDSTVDDGEHEVRNFIVN